jgi:hypothetical protein
MSKNHLTSGITFCFIYCVSFNEMDVLKFSDDYETCLLIISDIEDQDEDTDSINMPLYCSGYTAKCD